MRCDKHWGLPGYYAGQECPYCEPEPVQARGAGPAHVEITFQYGGEIWTTEGHIEFSFDDPDAPGVDPAPDPTSGPALSSDFKHALAMARQMTHYGLNLTEAQLEGIARAWTLVHTL